MLKDSQNLDSVGCAKLYFKREVTLKMTQAQNRLSSIIYSQSNPVKKIQSVVQRFVDSAIDGAVLLGGLGQQYLSRESIFVFVI